MLRELWSIVRDCAGAERCWERPIGRHWERLRKVVVRETVGDCGGLWKIARGCDFREIVGNCEGLSQIDCEGLSRVVRVFLTDCEGLWEIVADFERLWKTASITLWVGGAAVRAGGLEPARVWGWEYTLCGRAGCERAKRGERGERGKRGERRERRERGER